MPDPGVVRQICATGAKLVVPNKDWLIRLPPGVTSRPVRRRIVVRYGDSPTDEDLEAKREEFGLLPWEIKRAEMLELHWASLSFDKAGGRIGPYGGRRSAVLG